ncbi:hypothetical protein HY494_02565 [Candidatus Woesearchaeota archaeon]|nr:hypothetical protein [Candidatus Woesearchaeota archaeon]
MQLSELVEKTVSSINPDSVPFDSGAEGMVYLVDEEVVLKLYMFKPINGSERISAEKEFTIGQDLYLQGIQVPQYFGLFEPKPSPLNYWGILMERIHGVKYKFLPGKLKREAKIQYRKQRRLIEKLGYCPVDSDYDHNALFDRQKMRLYLYDFVHWEKNNQL